MRQRLGQHFLTDLRVAETAAQAVASPASTVIEVGPGHGELTDKLLSAHGGKLVLIEKDPLLARELLTRYKDEPRVVVVPGDVRDCLASTVSDLSGEHYNIAGNIPYYLTSFLLRQIGELEQKPDRTVLLIQAEVATRVAATAPHFNKLACHVQLWATPRILTKVPRTAFNPPPEVTSAIIQLDTLPAETLPSAADLTARSLFANAAFKQPRKLLVNNLAESYQLPKASVQEILSSLGLSHELRPQDLDTTTVAVLATQFTAQV